MPVLADFKFSRYTDGLLTLSVEPPTPIAGWSVEMNVQRNFGGVSGVMPTKSYASGYWGVSGIAILNSGAGIMQIKIDASDTSGLEYGNYAGQIVRVDSGSRTILSEGYLMVVP